MVGIKIGIRAFEIGIFFCLLFNLNSRDTVLSTLIATIITILSSFVNHHTICMADGYSSASRPLKVKKEVGEG